MGFIRRFGFFPGAETITLIEGVVIVDLPPPGAIQGVGVGTAGLVGEFTNASSAVTVDDSGNVTSKPKPVEIFSGQDMINKLGSFDPTLGDFGEAMGNGFVALRNKKFSRLICEAINIASPLGTRLWRTLPTNLSASNPTPVVPMQPGNVLAGTEFKDGAHRARSVANRVFTDDAAYTFGTDGVVAPSGLPASSQPFSSASADFINSGVQVGDALVLGKIVDSTTLSNNLPVADTTLATVVPAASTDLTAPMSPVDVTAFVTSTVGYAATGTLQIDGELMSYAGTTPASFTGLVRGLFGTTAAAHSIGALAVQQLEVASTAGYATAGTVEIGTELIDYTGVQATLFTGLTRGAHGSTPAAHAAADPVIAQVTVASVSGFSATGRLLIGIELIDYTGTVDNLFTGITRAANGTVQATHLAGVQVSQVNDAGTFRVNTVVDLNNLLVEFQGSDLFTTLNWTALSALPWRLHVARAADTGGAFDVNGSGAHLLPARPLDATVDKGTNMPPTVVAAAATSSSWNPLSGLTMRTHPSAPGLAFDAAVQGVNPVNSPSLDALYLASIDGYLGQSLPERDVNLIWSARSSANIRTKLKSHVLDSSSVGVGRMASISPELSVQDTTTATGDTDPGVGANRNERVTYSWPGVRTFVPEAVNVSIAAASGAPTTDGVVDIQSDGWLVAVMSNLPPERNPGQAAPPVPEVLSPVIGIQRGVASLTMLDYIQMRQKGIAGPIIDRSAGPLFQSGITTSLISGEKNINRRRMADFIEDSVAARMIQFTKLPLTNSLKDGIEAEANAFLDSLLSPDNPAAQRINDYQVDPKSGNTPELLAQGIFVLIVRVQTTPTADFIVTQFEIGEGVQILRAA